MGGVNLTLSIEMDDREVRAGIRRLAERGKNLKPFFQIGGERLYRSVWKNFAEQGRPNKWEPLAPATVARKKKTGQSPLILHGRVSGGLLGSIAVRVGDDEVQIGPGPHIPYAWIQQKGGMAGRGRKVKIPARPYLVIQDDDEMFLTQELRRYITEVW